jgi:3-deoxy-manno-octulosonate cytidylyltransferase (CMP-KDO synthetase)
MINSDYNLLFPIRLVITDVDGVLTDGGLYYDANGEALKRFHVRDGMGIRMLEESGLKVAVLSGRDSPPLRKRVEDLKIDLAFFGVKDKAKVCLNIMEQVGVSPEQTLFIGDDTIDLVAFAVCGVSCAVGDAPDYIKNQATLVLNTNGGYGAFRELSDAILRSQGKEDVFETVEGYSRVMNKMAQ